MKRITMIFLAGSLIALLAISVPLQTAQAWNCQNYNFSVEQNGDVFVENQSGSNELAQNARVYIDGGLVATLSVPALAQHTSWTLIGHVDVPNDGFTWEVVGTVDCRDDGKHEKPTPTPTNTPDTPTATNTEMATPTVTDTATATATETPEDPTKTPTVTNTPTGVTNTPTATATGTLVTQTVTPTDSGTPPPPPETGGMEEFLTIWGIAFVTIAAFTGTMFYLAFRPQR